MAEAHLELVYRYICDVYQAEQALPTVERMMDACHMSKGQVQGALRTLRQRGWLKHTEPMVVVNNPLSA